MTIYSKLDKIFQNGISWNISSTEAHIKSYSSHKWKQTNFSKMEYLENFLQLRRRNRQYIPKQNLLWRLVNIFPVQYSIQEVSYFGCSSCSKVPFVLLTNNLRGIRTFLLDVEVESVIFILTRFDNQVMEIFILFILNDIFERKHFYNERPKEWELIPEYWLNFCV